MKEPALVRDVLDPFGRIGEASRLIRITLVNRPIVAIVQDLTAAAGGPTAIGNQRPPGLESGTPGRCLRGRARRRRASLNSGLASKR